jgi:hypothetical protein
VLESGKDVLAKQRLVVMEFNTLCLSVFGRINPCDAISHGFLSENILARGALDNLVCSWD